MERKLFCSSVIVYLISSVAVALPSKNWGSNGWTTESSHRSAGWQKAEAKHSDTWKHQATAAVGDDSQGQGWVSSENVGSDSKTKAVPTSWQQVDRHHGSSVKSSGWTNIGQKSALNPPSQDIANGIVVHHPIPSSNHWNNQFSPESSWNTQHADEFWTEDVNKKSSSSSSTAAWEKASADAIEQWKQNQTPDVTKSDASSTSLWDKHSSPSAWDRDSLNDRESAAGYAATGPAEYGQGSSISAWQEKSSNDGWQKNSPQPITDAWKKDSSPSTLYDAPPSKWDNKPSSDYSASWQKASSNGWVSSSDLKTWQKETNGWTDSAAVIGGWPQGHPDVTTQKPWQDDSSNGWHKSTGGSSSGWNKH